MSDPFLPGQMLDGRYRIERELGAGNMGAVLLATDVHLERRVAIKRMRMDREDVATVARFRREAAALAAVRNEHVAGVHAYGVEDGAPFFVMEYVDGVDLEDIVSGHGSHGNHLSIHRGVTVLARIARGLAAVHARGLVHRDVKPANVVVESGTGRPVLVDFGLAARGPENPDEAVIGTPAYMAPEATHPATYMRLDPRSDIYSLGCTAYEVLTGEVPFPSAGIPAIFDHHRLVSPPRPSSRRPELARLDDVLLRAIAKRPDDRFPSASALASALEDGLDAEGASSPESVIATAPGEGAAVRVLVVDDDPIFARLAARAAQIALHGTPIEVRRVRAGRDAIENAARKRPQLLVLDFQMPEMDGIEVLSRLRAMPGGGELRVLVASGRIGPAERWRFQSLGVQDFADKPVDFAALTEAIAAIAKRELWFGAAGDPPTVRQGPG